MFIQSQQSTYVDDFGVFRWSKSKEEIRLFGVNYTLPFAHGFRAINYVNKDHKNAIDKDVYHLSRLDVNAFRVHIWDAEVTDSLGNLINSPQLDLLDYTLAKMKERGFKTLITPFKVGDNGYPEKNVPTQGFSNKLEKWQTYADEKIIEKQIRYFTQLLNHVNPYTGIAYKNDPDIIALEINNEPTHDNGPIATKYINRMVEVIRKVGFKNPIFYNISEVSKFVDNYLDATIQGCTFQWYPTGLVRNRLLEMNNLPNVDAYQIPFKDKKKFQNKARIIYEFDPGDTNQATLFPAMARSFREAKFQFAAQFAYDPIDLAFANTEYQTHYFNLAYTPSKAISFKIAAAVFRETPNGKSFGRYPNNNTFGNTTLNPDKNLAIYNSETAFFYTNSTEVIPKNIKNLKNIAGIGASNLVTYSGTGAYFLDKIENGIWRLEILPDVVWVNDPFAKASLKKTVAVLQNNQNDIEISLSDLGATFYISGINTDNTFSEKTTNQKFKISPGTYLLHAKNDISSINKNQKLGTISLNEFATTQQEINQTYVVHSPKNTIEKNTDLWIEAAVVSPSKIEKVEVVWPSGYQKTTNYLMEKIDNFHYKVMIPKNNLYGNEFTYHIVVYTENDSTIFPDNSKGNPIDWDFVPEKKYTTKIVQSEPIIVLFDASNESEHSFLWPAQRGYRFETSAHKISSENTLNVSVNNLKGEIADFTFKMLVEKSLKNDSKHLNSVNSIQIEAASGTSKKQKVQIAIQQKNGLVFGKIIELTPEMTSISIPFSDLKIVPMVLLPRPYPGFQSYWFSSLAPQQFDKTLIEALQISIGPGINKENLSEYQGMMIRKILLK
ncbi:MAG: membrane or secreted protein [Flavobacteriaceae bacterium CG_4_8_14_3_um_filter_31_8]|nr:MAG: hypothetical protein AUK46_00765 [Flavobacteriaceae bacterium CG2_30_31_66]PIV95568.1 MAG: membrane or secreted protein [Flavobacteriaceae bacterium CG17_big_fil_post_rev_8_21_14_2_50_31_13]PIX12765.1 MAG: membrane or secreted protein [Flavobacteriaceae bacterium CG_4_8_14_3_um_filter_31_8]